ncbi:hypothetical protein [Clostridium pasteurianum]|uniref:Uncharacterized protein n=1 Tax=Clostridium pasteurianum BC1 TaxID=86416 RepID=R4K8B6_CLOPA|nr:hypothetical protein [Clostridium pasteurianum]AGK96769.1 hypothetical protein Clopa_1869 [Clostridium pasteurianum BC1]
MKKELEQISKDHNEEYWRIFIDQCPHCHKPITNEHNGWFKCNSCGWEIDIFSLDEKLGEKLSVQDYEKKMKLKYKDELEFIDAELLSEGSFERGQSLYDILDDDTRINPELKYYVFLNWWTSIDSGHELFDPEDIKLWRKIANVEIDISDLKLDDDFYITVYRGVNEYSQSWEGLSWTTDKEIALKFAWGATVRHRTKQNLIFEGKVSIDNIIARIDDRNEAEVLIDICYKQEKALDVKELLDVEEKYNKSLEEIKEGKAEHTLEFEELKKKYEGLLTQCGFDVNKHIKQ